jgi:CheY-like chemotaxis protein
MSAEQNVTEMPANPVSQTSDHQDGESFGSGGYELDEDGQRVPHGMGISKSSRRRRRKRKGKSGDGAVAQGEGTVALSGEAQTSLPLNAGQTSAPPAVANSPQPQQGFRQNNQQQGRSFGGQQNGSQNNGSSQNAPGGTKRWKKKFRDRDRPRDAGGQQGQQGYSASNGGGSNGAGFQQNGGGGGFRGPDTHQPGNSAGGFKRKGGFGGKQHGGGGGGSRNGFVGPMDHSYRVVNGNVFDVSPSTIEVHGNGGGGHGRGRGYAAQSDSQPIDYSQGRVIPIAEGTPTKIYFFIDDLFFTAKIQETARKMGVKVAFVKNEKEQIAALTAAENEDHPGLIVFDLNNANAKPMTLIPKLKAKLKKTTSIIGFLSHLQGDLKAKAVEAGCDTVMPRAAFSQNLPNLLRRYGIEEVDEPNFNQ